MKWFLILAIILFICYMVYTSLGNTLYVIVYSMNPEELEQSKKFIRQQYPGLLINYKVYSNQEEFTADYGNLLILRKKCLTCKFIPLGDVKYLTNNLPLDYWDGNKDFQIPIFN